MEQSTVEKANEKMVNGVAVDKLFGTIDAVKTDPEIAKFKFRATNKWINGGHNHTTITDFYGAKETHKHENAFELPEDEPPVLLGEDKGANPVEYALTALAGCLTSSMIYHAAAKGIVIKGVESRLEGDLDLRGFLGISQEVEVGYQNIRAYFKIDADLTEQQKEELILMAQKYSPVFNTIANRTPIEVQLERK